MRYRTNDHVRVFMQHVCYGEVGEDRRPGRTRAAQPQIVRHPEDAVRTDRPELRVGFDAVRFVAGRVLALALLEQKAPVQGVRAARQAVKGALVASMAPVLRQRAGRWLVVLVLRVPVAGVGRLTDPVVAVPVGLDGEGGRGEQRDGFVRVLVRVDCDEDVVEGAPWVAAVQVAVVQVGGLLDLGVHQEGVLEQGVRPVLAVALERVAIPLTRVPTIADKHSSLC